VVVTGSVWLLTCNSRKIHCRDGAQVLGTHMLEVCPSITNEKTSAEVHPLSIGGKEDPVRLVFTAAAGKAVNA
jgi:L-arabinose isomerase